MAIVRNLAQNGSFDGTDSPRAVSLKSPASPVSRVTIAPSDTVMLNGGAGVRGVIVAVAGNIHFLDGEGIDRTEGFTVGEWHQIMLKIFATGTTATGLQVLV